MSEAFGLYVTDQESTAVVVSAVSGESMREPLVTPTVLYFLPGGTSTLRRPESLTGEIDVADRFVAHVGDPAGVVSGRGVPMRAEDLLATTMLLLLTELSAPDDITTVVAGAAYPADWQPEQVGAVREALDFLGLDNVTLYAEAPGPGLDSATAAARAATGLSTPSLPTPAPPATDRRLFYATAAAGVAAALLILGAGVTYVLTDRTVTTAVPGMQDATAATTQPTTTRSVPSTSIAFPTVSPGAATVAPPVAVPETAAPRAPLPAPTIPAPVPAPIPAPGPVDPPVTEIPITTTPAATTTSALPESSTTTVSTSPTPAE